MPDSRSTAFVLAGAEVQFPAPAVGTAVKNAAKRFEAAWGLPAEAAFATAASIVDPASARQAIDPKDPFEHLQRILTPDGKVLLAVRTTVWTALVSGDGGNGRSRFSIQTAAGRGRRTRPWPIGRHHKPAIIDYHTSALEEMAAAAKLSADAIRSPDLITQIARNPRGIWNPPVVVMARAYVKREGGVEERFFTHTIEGSTRVEACHELCGVDPAAPLLRSDKVLDHLRESHAQLVEMFETTPTSSKALAAFRAATMPALIVVAAVDGEAETPISEGFPAVVSDYVESVHVQPRPFSDIAQNNVIGERFVLKLQEGGRIPHADAEAILGRSASVPGKPSVRAAKLVHAICDNENDALVRDFVITADNARLTKVKRAKLIGPLVLRQFDQVESTADAALMKAFTPDLLIDKPWEIIGDDSASLRRRCLADHEAGKIESAAIAELMARGGPALCAAGLILSDQESTVMAFNVLRGHVDRVITGLTTTRGGINVLADAVAWADGDRRERPRDFDVEGNPRVDANNDQLHFAPEWRKGNMGVRALALNKGVMPTSPTPPKPDDPPQLSPEEGFHRKEEHLLELLGRANTVLVDLYAAKDGQGRKLIESLGLKGAPLYENFPTRLTRLYAKYGNADDGFDEDDLPDDNSGPSDDGDGEEE
ncbi:hypothetical protein [Mycobacterium intracellulare]|uniref:hypothetical protein n=1 Tax=Mycobacterium intracellulare TaxID=1767 RepID=UPI001915AF6D|nr:hypothetical protein [Mycobacterium intracellulare]